MTIRSSGDVRADDLQRQLDEAHETFRLIAEAAGADGTEPDDWRAMTHPPKGEFALRAVRELRKDYDAAHDTLDKF